MMPLLKPLVILALAAVSLTACATIQLTSDQTMRLPELQAFADQIAKDLGSVTVQPGIQLGLRRRLGADRPIHVFAESWIPFVVSYRVVVHPELLSTRWCAEWTVAHGLEWVRQGYAGESYVAPLWMLPIILGIEAARAKAAEEIRGKVAAETGARLRQLRGWTETEFLQARYECELVATKLKAQE